MQSLFASSRVLSYVELVEPRAGIHHSRDGGLQGGQLQPMYHNAAAARFPSLGQQCSSHAAATLRASLVGVSA